MLLSFIAEVVKIIGGMFIFYGFVSLILVCIKNASK